MLFTNILTVRKRLGVKSEERRMKEIEKNGVPLTETKYRLTPILKKMTKRELIEEILSTHPWDYLLESGMVEVK